MPLSDTQIRNAKPGLTPQGKQTDKPYKMGDSGGLYLEVAPSGGKWWCFKYRFDGKQKRMSLGVYPGVSLKAARARRDEARALLAEGVDPGEHRKALKAARADRAANSYEVIAREWHAKHTATLNPVHAERILRRQERDLFPWLGPIPITDVTAPVLLESLRRIEGRGAIQTAHRA